MQKVQKLGLRIFPSPIAWGGQWREGRFRNKKNSQKISFCKKALLYLFIFLQYKYVKQSLPLSYRYFFALAAAIAPLRRIPLIPPLEDEDGSELLFNPGGGPWSDMNLHRNW